MNKMISKSALLASLVLVAASASATNFGDTNYNQPTANGGDALSIAGASSVAEAKANAAALAAQQQGQVQGQQQSSASNVKNSGNSQSGSLAGVADSGNSHAKGNTTSVDVGGTVVERSAPSIFAGNVPNVVTSCRLYLFGGGSNVTGAVSGTIPLGNDQTCLSGKKLVFMEIAGGFSQEEKQQVACKVEGMEELATCQKFIKK